MPLYPTYIRLKPFVLSEASNQRSRESIVVTQTGVALASGQILGKIRDGSTATVTPRAGNVGNGAMGAVTVGTAARAGRYVLSATSAGATAAFEVEDPSGQKIGQGAVGSAFSAGGLGFTLADGAADYAINDVLYIDVADGSGKYVAFDAAGTDGREVAAGVLYEALRAATGDIKAVGFVRDCEVSRFELSGLTVANTAQLAALGVIVRGDANVLGIATPTL